MRTYIFSNHERQLLIAYLGKADVDETKVSKVMDQIRKYKTLFEDVYLYLSVKKTDNPRSI